MDYLIRVQRHKAPLLRPILAIGCTDIDDKIVKRAKEEKMEMGEITRKYEREFYDALKWAGCEEPDVILRVTEHIGDIIAFIRVLVDNGNAYVLENDGVYFDTSAMDSRKEKYGMGYGGWFNRGLEFQSDGFESEKKRDGKKNERDFALWKIYDTIDEHNYSYPSPFGRGRPGWHIECSAMIKKFEVTYSKLFGKKMVVSLHGGGKDLVFPHHENEVAQSTTYEAEYEDSTDNNSNSLTSRPGGKWIEEWIHTGHLNVKGGKMSKSDKTGVSYQSLGCHGDVFRWWVLADSGRWDQDAVFEERRVSEAEGKLDTIRNFMSADVDELVGASTDDLDLVAAVRAAEDSIMDEIEKVRASARASTCMCSSH
ncbi:hypothetical protein TL16_g01597 [Triparma laevis f. inornata]|uniref:tRNA synthetases class I catalytic domain-containing protein n=1 Tax=Triparma laevis f. inornata TaxID=1714386 RepID=A0A9W6ZL73_9STRA|nr:hypothetical protein TL16_g01597 [Triparma laevis f. inornata]